MKWGLLEVQIAVLGWTVSTRVAIAAQLPRWGSASEKLGATPISGEPFASRGPSDVFMDWGYTSQRTASQWGSTSDPDVYDVRAYGAVGDGVTDDSPAFAVAMAAGATAGGVLVVPPGVYLIAKTLTPPPSLSILGSGWSACLLWAHDDDLIVWDKPSPRLSVADLAIVSVGTPKSPNSTALRFGNDANSGAQRVEIDHVLVYGQPGGPIPNTTVTAVAGGSAFDLGAVSDTSTVRDCILWFFGSGTGIKIGRGSEIRIEGGRVIGGNKHTGRTIPDAIAGAVGIHVTGNNGGVHVMGTDVIGLGIGMLLEDASGQGSNREIFITQATFDSDGVGLLVRDNSYVSIAGCWAASSDVAQIWLGPTAHGALLSVTGGTIFNGGAYFSLPAPSSPCAIVGGCNGLLVEAGTFLLTGVAVRNNHGVGVAIHGTPSTYPSFFSVTGCQIFANGAAFDVTGGAFSITGNVVHGNFNDSHVTVVHGSEPSPVIANNVGFQPAIRRLRAVRTVPSGTAV
eukprot:m.105333 g.105333  ORF g.105333 m.105333 type:complete len:511 (-) comp12642_c0_seq3:76-1608(-)